MYSSCLPGVLPTYLAAMMDASREIPSGDDPGPWVRGVYRQCSARAEYRAGRWVKEDARRLAVWLGLRAQLAHLQAELERALAEVNRLAAERLQRGALSSERTNPMSQSLNGVGYAISLVILCSLELPLVFMSFTALGLPPVFTGLLSLLCAGLTAFLGHVIGTLTRHLKLRASWMLGTMVLLAAAFTSSLALLREGALEVIRSDAATLNPITAGFCLFIIATASLATAALLAWHHGVDPEDRDLYRATLRHQRLVKRVQRLQGRAQRVGSERLGEQANARQEVLRLGQQMLGALHRYARINQRYRDKNDLPASLRDENLPRLTVPAILEQPLIWTLQETELTEGGPARHVS